MEGNESLDALFLFATEGILVVDDSGTIIRINPSAEKLFGYGHGELLGQNVDTLVPKKQVGKHQGHREKYTTNPHARSMGVGTELHGLKKDGSEFPVEISLSPYVSGGKKFVIAFVVDITTRKQAEEKLKNYSIELEAQVRNRTLILEEAILELEKTKKDLNKALEKEKELSSLKTRFVSMASHEFRTPLTTMMSSLSLISKYGENRDLENQNKHIQKIKNSINNLTDILNDLLSVSKLEEGKIINNPEELNLKSFIQDIITETRSMAQKGQNLNFSFEGQELAFLDKKIVTNILFNLISNAIKFSPHGSPIEIRAAHKNKVVKIEIQDFGIGIAEADQKHLFERFFRGHNATNIQGTGLGLSIVVKYLELMDGQITLHSEENKGSVFTVSIPQ